MRRSFSLLFFFLASSFGCGGGAPNLPDLTAAPDDPTCAAATGSYAATFTLLESEGSCDAAKKESHDPMEFDSDGRFKSPVENVIDCKSVQVGCQLAVRCTTQALLTAKGALDATLSADGSELHGTGTLEGSYKGCDKLIYDVQAHRKPAAQ